MKSSYPSSWLQRVTSAAFTLLAIAIMLRIAWDLVRPLVPAILVVTVITGLVLAAVRYRRTRW